MLGIGYPDRHALLHITPKKCTDREVRSPTARAGSFVDPLRSFGPLHETEIRATSGLSGIGNRPVKFAPALYGLPQTDD